MSTEPQDLPAKAANKPFRSTNPALERLLGHAPELSARARGGSVMYRWWLSAILLLGALVCLVGIGWGLPSTANEPYLFGGEQPWTGETISQLADTDARFSTSQAANIDVDAGPPAIAGSWENLTPSQQARADITVRYRLYSHHPDEMTVFQAIRAMDPTTRDFDPKMYQYGGAFIYPVAALLKLVSYTPWLELRSDVSYYLDNPEDFAPFFLVARGYVALFMLLGILAAYKLGTALRDRTAGLMAALLFVFLPVVINMSHEAKPHLPAAVLAMWAVYAAIRYIQKPRGGAFIGMSVLCGLAVGMVPAAAYVLVLILLAAFAPPRSAGRVIWRLVGGTILAALVYLVCNPYVAINLFANPGLLRSNFENTSGMYAFGNPLEGLRNTLRLILEATSPVLAVAALLPLLSFGHRRTWPRLLMLAAPAVVVLLIMVVVGANKPGEFGRFGIYVSLVLMLAVATEVARIVKRSGWAGILAALLFICTTGVCGLRYLQQFRADATNANTRMAAAAYLADVLAGRPEASVGVFANPAPYAVPPMDFTRVDVLRWRVPPETNRHTALADLQDGPEWIVFAADRPRYEGTRLGDYELKRVFRGPPDRLGQYNTVISWANKPICVWQRQAGEPVAPASPETEPPPAPEQPASPEPEPAEEDPPST
ncbi:MAG: glycosyltransferase family 39 protein [Phycisphaerales bacterium]|nr:MAG: glycosyltransferase family 39 protein [Phycisphaerales bacterium]